MENFFNKQIIKEMEIANVSLLDLAEGTKLDGKHIDGIISGAKMPNAYELMKIARFFGKHDGYFFQKVVFPKI